MTRGFSVLVWTLGSLLALAAAHAQSAPEITDGAAQFWKRIARAKTITYTMKMWGYDDRGFMAAQPGTRIFYVENTYEVKAQRPNRLAISISPGIEREVIFEGGDRSRQFHNSFGEIYINNGKQSIRYMTQIRTYSVGKGLDALAKDESQLALHVHTDWIFDPKPMEGYRFVPESLVTPSTTVVFTLSDPRHPDVQERCYFDRKTGNLVQYSYLNKDDKGNWNERERDEFQFWDFDARLPSDTFSVRPMRTYMTRAEFNKIHNIPPASTVAKPPLESRK